MSIKILIKEIYLKIYHMLLKNIKQEDIKVKRKMGWEMVLENFIIMKEVFIKAPGKII
jgi:hypothetical protein